MATTPVSNPRVDVHRPDGSATGTRALDPHYFGLEPNVALMHQVVTAQLAAARAGTQSTKTRSEVSGGGAKPWRQKGTGRARQGSNRAPHWSGGGIALGPKPRSYQQKTPKKMISLALRSALSDRAAQRRIALVESWGFETPRTKDAIALLAAMGVEGKVLVVVDREDHAATLSFRNLPHVRIILAGELNAYDVLCSDWVVFTETTLPGVASETTPVQPGAAPAAPTAEASAPVTEEPPAAAEEPADEPPVPAEGFASGTEGPTGEAGPETEEDSE